MGAVVVAGLADDTLRQAYAGKRVFVTGDTGFKGSWLVVALAELGAEVRGYALPPERDTDHFVVAGIGSLVRHQDADIRDAASLAEAVRSFAPDYVFHLAAQPLVRPSYDDPKRTYDTNVGGSVNLLEAVRATPSVRSLVFVTSDKCYRNKEWVWGYRETDELGGDDPYSASKAAAELVFASYQASFFRKREGFGAATVRAGNVIGGGDWSPSRIVPDCARAVLAGQPIVLRNPGSTRPWQHVLEPVFGYLLLGARLAGAPERFRGSWNFGPRPEAVRTVGELAEHFVASWGAGSVRVEPQANAPHEAGLLQLSCDKARAELGWEAVWSFAAAVEESVFWYRSVAQDGAPALAVSRQQIARYLNGAGAG